MHNVVLQFRWYGFHTSRNVYRRFPSPDVLIFVLWMWINWVVVVAVSIFIGTWFPVQLTIQYQLSAAEFYQPVCNAEFSQFNYDYHWTCCVRCDCRLVRINSLNIWPLSVSWWLYLSWIIGDSQDSLHLEETHSNSDQMNVPEISVSLGNYGKIITLTVC